MSNSSRAPTSSAMLLERFGVEPTRVGRRAGDDHLRPMLEGQGAHLVHVDAVLGAGAVGDEVVEQAARVDRRTVGEMPAMVEAESEHRVAWLQERLVHAHVGVGARVRLDVGVVGTEEFLHPVDGELFDVVDDRIAAVVPLAGVSLGVLVREHGTDGGHHGRGGEVLAGDQLDAGRLALDLTLDEAHHGEVGIGV